MLAAPARTDCKTDRHNVANKHKYEIGQVLLHVIDDPSRVSLREALLGGSGRHAREIGTMTSSIYPTVSE